VKFVDPVTGVGREELAHRPRIRAVEVDGFAPFVSVLVGEIRRRKRPEVVPRRPEMVVDDVEDDGDTSSVRSVDEAPEVVRPSVQPGRCKQIDAVISPAEFSTEVGDGHHLDHRDPEARQLVELAHGRRPRALPRERADVHLVHDLAGRRRAAPRGIGPLECGGVDDLRGAMGAVRLES
jgi:hypothetical protein